MRSVCSAFLFLLLTCGVGYAWAAAVDAQAGIATFNRALDSATRNMDNVATLALWENDGISLLPSTPPIVGKQAIATFLDGIQKQYPGAHMQSFESQCFDIQVSGDLATEWCTEHQIVKLTDGKPPFDGRGKMLLVLHRGVDGKWRVRQEMWNQAAAVSATQARR
jgi:ketosteroid isomerase-like protein